MWMQGSSNYCIAKVNRHFFRKNGMSLFFVVDQNHELLSPSRVRFLPANRVITEDDKNCILLYKKARLLVREIICVMELKKNVKHEHLPFFQQDIRNL